MFIVYSVHAISCHLLYDNAGSQNAFVIFYSGERAKAKILKICDAFSANRYPFPEDVAKQIHTVQEVST